MTREQYNASHRAWYHAHAEIVSQRQKAAWNKDKEKSAAWMRAWKEKRKVEAAGRPRPSICELCGRLGKTEWDHDHKTKKFRGWICGYCNKALAMVDDSVERLTAMIAYLNNKGTVT